MDEVTYEILKHALPDAELCFGFEKYRIDFETITKVTSTLRWLLGHRYEPIWHR